MRLPLEPEDQNPVEAAANFGEVAQFAGEAAEGPEVAGVVNRTGASELRPLEDVADVGAEREAQAFPDRPLLGQRGLGPVKPRSPESVSSQVAGGEGRRKLQRPVGTRVRLATGRSHPSGRGSLTSRRGLV
jgi:hypothetical protein